MRRLNRHTDVVLVSYYQIRGDFSVRSPETVKSDFRRLVKVYLGRMIYVADTGYPSSQLLGSSTVKQRQYIVAVFSAWDTHSVQIGYLSFAWYHDQPTAQLDQFERYNGSSNPHFRAFLATLGLRERDGTPKPAIAAVRHNITKRDWK